MSEIWLNCSSRPGSEVRLRHFRFMRIEYPRARSHYLTVVGQFLMPSSGKATVSFDSERRVLNRPHGIAVISGWISLSSRATTMVFFNWCASATRSPNPMYLHVAVDNSRRPFRTLLQLSPRIFAGHRPPPRPARGKPASEQTFLLLIQHTPRQCKCGGDESVRTDYRSLAIEGG